MSIFAILTRTAADIGLVALQNHPGAYASQGKGKKDAYGGCTPCAVQARKDRAEAFVTGVTGGPAPVPPRAPRKAPKPVKPTQPAKVAKPRAPRKAVAA